MSAFEWLADALNIEDADIEAVRAGEVEFL